MPSERISAGNGDCCVGNRECPPPYAQRNIYCRDDVARLHGWHVSWMGSVLLSVELCGVWRWMEAGVLLLAGERRKIPCVCPSQKLKQIFPTGGVIRYCCHGLKLDLSSILLEGSRERMKSTLQTKLFSLQRLSGTSTCCVITSVSLPPTIPPDSSLPLQLSPLRPACTGDR